MGEPRERGRDGARGKRKEEGKGGGSEGVGGSSPWRNVLGVVKHETQ